VSNVFSLPAYSIGPYTMAPVPGDRDSFSDPRLRFEQDWSLGIVRLDALLEENEAFDLFVRHLVKAIHYRSGVDETSSEESLTQSLATGLVEIATGSPQFWQRFNELLGERLRKPRYKWAYYSTPGYGDMPPEPKRLTYGSHCFPIVAIPANNNYYGWCDFEKKRIEISVEPQGKVRSVVTIHESIHFMHHAEGLTDKTPTPEFTRRQAAALIKFWDHNPKFWAWWLRMTALAGKTETQ
jgi:hypothetical protein